VIYPGSTPVGNATLVVANVLTCNKHTPIKAFRLAQISRILALKQAVIRAHLAATLTFCSQCCFDR
jgi:hypothetical protein